MIAPPLEEETVDVYARASMAAAMILGKRTASDDPLAWWCLVELIVSFGNAGPHRPRRRKIR